jgi:hypothetical protein
MTVALLSVEVIVVLQVKTKIWGRRLVNIHMRSNLF